MTDPTTTAASAAAQSQDIIQKADAGLTHLEDTAGAKVAEIASLAANAVTHFNALLGALGSTVKIGVSAAENGIGGTANLVVSTEDALKGLASAQTKEPLAAPPAGLTTAAG